MIRLYSGIFGFFSDFLRISKVWTFSVDLRESKMIASYPESFRNFDFKISAGAESNFWFIHDVFSDL